MTLADKIMNIRQTPPVSFGAYEKAAYNLGYWNARYQAAELAIADEASQQPAQRKMLIDLCSTFSTLNIGRDHGITPQAAAACRKSWAEIERMLGNEEMARDVEENAFRNCHCKD